MNDKTAKLIRKYAGRTDEDKTILKRRWMAMDQEERRRFRQRMIKVVESEEEADEPEDVEA